MAGNAPALRVEPIAPYLPNEGTGRQSADRGREAEERRVSRIAGRPNVDPQGSWNTGLAVMQQGAVKFYKAEKGYGFIKPDGGGPDIFVHISAVEQAGLPGLSEGQRIAFDVEPDKKGKGPKAVNLQLL